jgi:murein DD-endopeptidase MepM/ murein hydrolase activator NlpD
MIMPIANGIVGRRYNRTLHGRSVYRIKDVSHHNVVKGYSSPGTGDAIDIFVPAGTPVYAMHDGYISRITDPGGRLSCIYIQGAFELTVYAHMSLKLWIRLKNYLSPRQFVKAGQCIGYVGRKLSNPHLHLEVWLHNTVVSGKTSSELARKIAALSTP